MKKYLAGVVIFLFLPLFVSAACIDFTRTLKLGMEGEDVHELQQVLNSNKLTEVAKEGPGSLGKEDMYFGKATEKAVVAFQKLYAKKIYPNEEKPNYSGTLDESTRIWLHDASCEVNVVNISSGLGSGKCAAFPVSTSTVKVLVNEPYNATVHRGDLFSIFGTSFTGDNTIDIGNTSLCKQGSLEEGTRMDFKIPLDTPLGYQYLRVVNTYGKSNLIRLLILEEVKRESLPLECLSIRRSLSIGSKGADVEGLQRFLNSDPRTTVSEQGAGSRGNESTTYGPAVANAVKVFQMLYRKDVLAPAKILKPTGTIGTLSANKIRSITQCRQGEDGILGAPYIDSIAGKVLHLGEMVKLSGKNFTQKTTVNLCGKQVSVVSADDGRSLSFIVPMDIPLGSCRISVTSEFGTSGSQRVTIASGGSGNGALINTKPPVLTTLLPSRGKIGDEVVVKGKYFTANTMVSIAGLSAKSTVKGNDELIFVVPPGISVGSVPVLLRTVVGVSAPKNFQVYSGTTGGGGNGGGGATSTNPVKKVVIYSVSPYTVIPGNEMRLSGDGFTADANEIIIDGQSALTGIKGATGKTIAFTLATSTKAGTHVVAVQNANGLSNTRSFYVDRSTLDAPALVSVVPNPVGMGATLTLHGKNFTDENSISIDGVLTAEVKSENGGTKALVELAENIRLGKHRVSLANSNGRTGSVEFEVTYGTGPYLTKVSPTSAKTFDVIKLTGVNLSETVITIGEITATATIAVDGKSADVVVPSGLPTGLHDILATGSKGKSNVLSLLVQAVGAPSVSRVQPSTVEVLGSVTIYGRQFTEANAILLNGNEVAIKPSSAGINIQWTLPLGVTAGEYRLSVRNKYGTSNEVNIKVNPISPPEITSVNPNPAYAGYPVAIQGSGFVNPNTIKIGTHTSSNALSSTVLQAVVPASLTPGNYPVQVTNTKGESNIFTLTVVSGGNGGGTTTDDGTRRKPVITDIEFPNQSDLFKMLAMYTVTIGFKEPEFDYTIRGMNFSKKSAKVVIGIGDGGIGFDGELRSPDGSSFVATIKHGGTNNIGSVKDHLTWIKDIYFGKVCIKALVQQTSEEGGLSDQFEKCKKM